MTPSMGLDAVAYSFLGMRPAPAASVPASTARRMAWAIRSGSRAPAIPVLSRTPSQPSSIAMRDVAGRADPGVDDHRVVGSSRLRSSRMIRMLLGLRTPCPLPIGLPAGITLAAPASLSRRAMIGSSLV